MTHIGDIGLVKELVEAAAKQPAKRVRKVSATTVKLLEAAEAIRLEPTDAEAAFMARHLVQCTLPHSDPGDVPSWSRKSGAVTLGIQPGWDFEKERSIGYPYGTIPRLLLFWLTTELVRVKDDPSTTIDQKRTVVLGRRLDEFMRKLGLSPETGHGKRGDRKRLQEQMRRLFHSHISFSQPRIEGDVHGEKWMRMEVAPKGELWWDVKQPGQSTLFESWIKVGEDFYNAVTATPVPVDLRALRALKRSPLALDLYALMTYATFIANSRGIPVSLAWRSLAKQFGGDYTDVKNFKKKVKLELRKVQIVYPGLAVTDRRGGLTVHTGQTAIAARSQHGSAKKPTRKGGTQ